MIPLNMYISAGHAEMNCSLLIGKITMSEHGRSMAYEKKLNRVRAKYEQNIDYKLTYRKVDVVKFKKPTRFEQYLITDKTKTTYEMNKSRNLLFHQ